MPWTGSEFSPPEVLPYSHAPTPCGRTQPAMPCCMDCFSGEAMDSFVQDMQSMAGRRELFNLIGGLMSEKQCVVDIDLGLLERILGLPSSCRISRIFPPDETISNNRVASIHIIGDGFEVRDGGKIPKCNLLVEARIPIKSRIEK